MAPLPTTPPGRILLQRGTQPLTFPPRCPKGNPREASSTQAAHHQCERGIGDLGWVWLLRKPSELFSFNSVIKKKFYKDRSMSICISIILLSNLQGMAPSSQWWVRCFTDKLNGTVMGTLGHFQHGVSQQPDTGSGATCECGP